jgi:hypothetical protein
MAGTSTTAISDPAPTNTRYEGVGEGRGHVLPTIHGADVATGWIPSKKYSCISHHEIRL